MNPRYTFRITDKKTRELVNMFLMENEHLNFSAFIRQAVVDAIIAQQNKRLARLMEQANELQSKHGGKPLN